MTHDDLTTRLTTFAERQHGLVRLTQFPPSEHRRVRHLADRGVIVRVATGVYRVCGSQPTWWQRLQIGVWALGTGVMVSHASAARLHCLDRFENVGIAEFTVDRGRRNRALLDPGSVVHSATVRLTGDLRYVQGLPVTSPERTIIDLARSGVATPLLEAAIDSAIRLRLTTLDHLIDRIGACQGSARRGLTRLDGLVLTSGGHSVLERRFLRLMRRHRLPAPHVQVVHRSDGRHVARVDFLFPDHDLVVEVSGGRGHSSAADRAKDARRRNDLQQMGRTVLEFTFEDVMEREDYVLRTLKQQGVSRS